VAGGLTSKSIARICQHQLSFLFLILLHFCRRCCSYGGWILDGFPVNKDQWSLWLERGTNIPDNVIFLQDESPNGDLLIERWYEANKVNADSGNLTDNETEYVPPRGHDFRVKVFVAKFY